MISSIEAKRKTMEILTRFRSTVERPELMREEIAVSGKRFVIQR